MTASAPRVRSCPSERPSGRPTSRSSSAPTPRSVGTTTLAAVASTAGQRLAPREIVMVVDHNRPLYERLRAALPDVMVVENREARGLSGARNTGIALAGGEVVAFLDDDADRAPDWLRYLTGALRAARGRGRRWALPSSVGHGTAPVVVPRGVRLGGRLRLSGPADDAVPGAEPHGRQRLVPP